MHRDEIKWLDFFAGINTIIITNENDFNKFRNFLDDIGLGCLLKNERNFSDWQHLSIINGHNSNCIIFEYQPGKGMTFGSTKEESKEWHGVEPLTVSVNDTIYNNSKLVNRSTELDKDLEDIEK